MARTKFEGGGSVSEVLAEAGGVEGDVMTEIAQTQGLIGKGGRQPTPRPGSHDALPNLADVVQKQMDRRSGVSPVVDLSAEEPVIPSLPQAAEDIRDPAPTPEPPSRKGGQAAPRAVVLRVHNKAKSPEHIERQLEVVSCPIPGVSAGQYLVERAGSGLLDLFGVPAESGRVYSFVVVEHPDLSRPAPRPNPFKPGTVL